MDTTAGEVTADEFKLFYTIDRDLYTILVQDFSRNPLECMHIMGFWLWLERVCTCSIIRKILSLSLPVINQLAEEALCCLEIVNNQFQQIPETANEIPLTRILIPYEISLQYLFENRSKVYNAIQSLVSCVYIPALSDIMEIARHGGSGDTSSAQSLITHAASSGAFTEMTLLSSHESPGSYGECSIGNQLEVPIPTANQMSIDSLFQSFSYMKIGGDIPSGNSGVPTSRCSRTMFATFSKGYPVTEQEVREYFTMQYGNCIESLHMQEVKSDKQALYARIVFFSPSIIHVILNGGDKAKFTINGKHVWMRKYVPRAAIGRNCGPQPSIFADNNG